VSNAHGFITEITRSTRVAIITRGVLGLVLQQTSISTDVADDILTLRTSDTITVRIDITSNEVSITAFINQTITVVVDAVTTDFTISGIHCTHTLNVRHQSRAITGIFTPLAYSIIASIFLDGTRAVGSFQRTVDTDAINIIARVNGTRVTIITIGRCACQDVAGGRVARLHTVTPVAIIKAACSTFLADAKSITPIRSTQVVIDITRSAFRSNSIQTINIKSITIGIQNAQAVSNTTLMVVTVDQIGRTRSMDTITSFSNITSTCYATAGMR
jgi:hypothetical protein